MATLAQLEQETDAAVVIVDREGFITYVNRPFEVVFEWEPGEIIGLPLTRIIPPHLRDAHHLGFSRFLATGKPTLLNQPLNLKAVTRTGREFEAEHFILAERRQGEWVFGALIRPLHR